RGGPRAARAPQAMANPPSPGRGGRQVHRDTRAAGALGPRAGHRTRTAGRVLGRGARPARGGRAPPGPAGVCRRRCAPRARAWGKRRYGGGGLAAIGGELDVTRWPWTIDVAAVPWVRRALEVAPSQLHAYARAVLARAGKSARTGGISTLVPEALRGVDAVN